MLISGHSFSFSLISDSLVFCKLGAMFTLMTQLEILPKVEEKDYDTYTGNCMFSRYVGRHRKNMRNCHMLLRGSAFIHTKSFDGPMTRALLHYLFSPMPA